MPNIRFCSSEEQNQFKDLVTRHKIVKEFHSVWSRWKNWESSPPLCAFDDNGNILGFHAYTLSKSGYINSLYLWIDESCRGLGMAGELIDATLKLCMRNGNVARLKMRCHKGSDGLVFWKGFGLEPIGEIEHEYFFDVDIEGIESASELAEYSHELNELVSEDKRTLNHYKKLGVKFTDPNWMHFNS